jgi:hypothetical protein
MSKAVFSAVQHIRKMRGGSQAHLMRASDGNFHVIKFQNNPQHIRVLANELFGTSIAKSLGLPVAEVQVIDVPEWLTGNSPDLDIEIAGHLTRCSHGLQLAVRYVADPCRNQVFDYLPESTIKKLQNKQDFARVLAFDKWTGNADGRQAVFTKPAGNSVFHATFIDQGYCFNAGEWNFADSAFRGAYGQSAVYTEVAGWASFEPALSRIEQFDLADLRELASQIPEEWYGHETESLCRLIEELYRRRSKVRDLLTAFRNSARNPFPNWTKHPS